MIYVLSTPAPIRRPGVMPGGIAIAMCDKTRGNDHTSTITLDQVAADLAEEFDLQSLLHIAAASARVRPARSHHYFVTLPNGARRWILAEMAGPECRPCNDTVLHEIRIADRAAATWNGKE